MSFHEFVARYFSHDALDSYVPLLILAISLSIILRGYNKHWGFVSYLKAIVILPILFLVVALIIYLFPYPTWSDPSYFQFFLALFVLLAILTDRIALTRIPVSRRWLHNPSARIGMLLLSLGLAAAGAYYVAGRPPWSDDPFVEPVAEQMISQRILFFPHDVLQFKTVFPDGLEVGEAGLVKVEVMERIDAHGKALMIPEGWITPVLVAPDYNVDVIDDSVHYTGFLIDRAPNNRESDQVILSQPIWSWIVRPRSTGKHMFMVKLYYAADKTALTRYRKNPDLNNANAVQLLLTDSKENIEPERTDQGQTSDFREPNLVPVIDEQVLSYFPVLLVEQGARVFVPPPFTADLAPWIAVFSGVTGILGIVAGFRRRGAAAQTDGSSDGAPRIKAETTSVS